MYLVTGKKIERKKSNNNNGVRFLVKIVICHAIILPIKSRIFLS